MPDRYDLLWNQCVCQISSHSKSSLGVFWLFMWTWDKAMSSVKGLLCVCFWTATLCTYILICCNLTAAVHFPTRIQNQSNTALDNIFIHNYKFTKYTASPIYSGLSDQNKAKSKLHGLSPRSNYTDRVTAACRRSDCQLLRIEGATWSAWRIPTAVFSVF
jgi:hypothetical protein